MSQRKFCMMTLWIVLVGCSPGPEVSLTGLVNELGGSDGLAGAQVCLAQSEPADCTATQDDGTYTLFNIASESNISLTVSKEGYLGGVIPVSTRSETLAVPVVSLGSSILVELQLGILNVEALADSGQLAFSISNGINGDGVNVANMKVSLKPSTGDGPFYSNESGLPDPDLEQTSVNGGGVFVNLAPGQYILQHTNLPESCTPMLGWGEASAITFEIIANRVTYARVECLGSSSP